MAVVLLHLAGLYDERTAVTLAEQIRRIYECDPKAHAYSGSLEVGQAFVHRDDMTDAFVRGRPVGRAPGRDRDPDRSRRSATELQETLARLIHGEEDWTTLSVPKPLARLGTWVEVKAEPLVPDDLDQSEAPFVRPFMVDMADDHYALDTSKAERLLAEARYPRRG